MPAFSAPSGGQALAQFVGFGPAGTALAIALVATQRKPQNTGVEQTRFVIAVICVFVLKKQCLEVHADAERNEVTVIYGGVVAVEEVGVTEARGIGVAIVGIDSRKLTAFATFVEVAARALGRVAGDVVGPGKVGLES